MNPKQLLFLTLILLLSIAAPFAQTEPLPPAEVLNKKGLALLQKKESVETFEKTIELLEEALTYFEQAKNWPQVIEVKAQLAELYYNLSNFESFEQNIESLKYLIKTYDITDSLFNETQKILTWYYEIKEDYTSAEQLYISTFEYDKVHSDKLTAAISANNMGYFYVNYISDPQRGLDYYQKSIQLLEQSDIVFEPFRAMLYSNLGHCLKETESLALAKNSFHKCLAIIPSDKNDDRFTLAKWWSYQELSDLYLTSGQLDSSQWYGQKALAILEEDGKSYWDDYQSYHTMGDYHIKTDNYPEGLKLYEKGVARAKMQADVFRPIHAIVGLAAVLSDHGDHQQALDSLQMGLQMLCPDFNETSVFANPLAQSFVHKKSALKLIDKKAGILNQLYKSNHEIAYLKAALQNYKLASEIIQLIRQDFVGDVSKYFLAEKVLSTYESAIEVAYKLHQLTKDNNYLEEAFHFAEQNKSVLLMESIKDNAARGFGNLPDSVLQQEKKLKLNLLQIEKSIYNEKKKRPLDTDKLNRLSDQQFLAKELYSNLIKGIEDQYPKYYEYKYRPAITSIKQLQQTLNKKTLLEYFVGEQSIFLFCIEKNKSQLLKIEKPDNFSASLEQLRAIISQPPLSDRYQSDLSKFNQLAVELYTLLLDKILDGVKNKQLIIVPDDRLIYLPFELLLQENNAATSFGVREQSYLMEDFAIAYSFSASLLMNTKDIFYSGQKGFAGFAPSFKNPVVQRVRNCGDGDLYSLQCNEQEVNTISSLFDGQTYIQEKASKNNFTEVVNEYSIIHLATHACVDETNPDFNRIYFTDDFLSNNDLTNMSIRANLAVLSACNTNVGPLMKGDGVSSISKGFILAGCPSILTSLWSVDDCSTSELMIGFYESLKKGNAKSASLRQAKLAYLDQADPLQSHPYYWAPFLISGQDQPIINAGISARWPWITLAVLGLLLAIFGFRYFQK